MIVLLPPSEGKAAGGDGPPLDLGSLPFPGLSPQRRRLVRALTGLARTRPDELLAALHLGERQRDALQANAALRRAATLPAALRYTGVLYDELGYASLDAAARRWADGALLVSSALFGLVGTRDLIPGYRLSGTTSLPGAGPVSSLWRPALAPVLAGLPVLAGRQRPVLDLRSGAYAAMGPVPGGLRVRVLREHEGRRTVVSHDNKYTKGRLVRALCLSRARTVADVLRAAAGVADEVESGPEGIDLVLHGLASARSGQAGG